MRSCLPFQGRSVLRTTGAKTVVIWASLTLVGLAFSLGSCGQPPPNSPSGSGAESASIFSSGSVTIIASTAPSTSTSTSSAESTFQETAADIGWPVIGCMIGDAWSEALGAVGEERPLSTVRRCRVAATRALGAKPDDDQAFLTLRSAEPVALQRTVETIGKAVGNKAIAERWSTLVRAVADAVRQAAQVQRAVKSVKGTTLVEADRLRSLAPTLRNKEPLANLYGLELGPMSRSARGLGMIVAAMHIEAARGLEPTLKLLTASPALAVVFGVETPAEPKAGDWLTAIRSAAAAAGYPAEGTGPGREQAAFIGMERGLVQRMTTTASEMPPGEGQDAVRGYAEKLQAAIDDVQRKKGGPSASASGSTAAAGSVRAPASAASSVGRPVR